ncbi:MAG TPA: hypothetical protein VFN10_06020 [Thermoanaerobaculia bacterium]|nr:hypothetical protein [Thermoanaerobaculia bacterium]
MSRTKPPVAAEEQILTLNAAGPHPAEDFVLWFAKAAGNRVAGAAFSFIMSRLGLGDPTPALLRDIFEQLSQVNAKLDRLQSTVESLAHRVDEAAFTNLMVRFKDLRADVNSINHHGLQEVALAAENLANVLSSPATPDQVEEATNLLQRKKEQFRELAGRKGADVNVEKITNLIASTASEDELVTGYGRLLLRRNRFLTPADSHALREFYDYLEQYQALAAIQRAEWQVAEGMAVETIRRSNAEFYNEIGTSTRPGWIQQQRAVLPEPIPDGTVIDIGTGADTTAGKTMLFVLGGADNGPSETDWRDPDPQGWSTAAATPVRVAAEFTGRFPPLRQAGWKDWSVITREQWNRLIGEKEDADLASAYLNQKFGLTSAVPGLREPFAETSAIWLDHHRNHTLTYLKGSARPRSTSAVFPVRARVRLHQSAPVAVEYAPELKPRGGSSRLPQLKPEFARAFAAARASLILTRTVDVNYMALQSNRA